MRLRFVVVPAALLLGLLCLAFAFGPEREGPASSVTKSESAGGVRLEFDARATSDQPTVTKRVLRRTINIMRARAKQLAARGARVRRSGATHVTATLPGVRDVARAAHQLGARGKLYLFDWEAGVLDAECRTNAHALNGGQRPIRGLHRAVVRASSCPAEPDADNTTTGAVHYAFDRSSKRALNDGVPEQSRDALLTALVRDGTARRAEIMAVPEGVIVVRAVDERARDLRRGSIDQWWVVRDEPVLDGADITYAKQDFQDGVGGQPIVTMDFSEEGRKAFADVTRVVARRGAENAGARSPLEASQHFAIRLDGELLTVPFIDYRDNPNGIEATKGIQISGGFTIQTARDLANLLAHPALPLQLHLVRSSRLTVRP